ncbi:MAG: M55 family metallopeptidase [Vicinamibacterales bacterium]
MRRTLVVVLALTALAIQPARTQPRGLKVHISVDMEGIAGVVTGDQLGPSGFEYGRFREFMTGEAMAAVTAAKEAGATEIVVADAHGNGENLLIEQFPPDVKIVRSWPRPLSMMGGLDRTFDAAIFIGYHASTTNRAGVRAHTFSSATLTRVALNGVEMTEGSWNAAIAGHFDVPIVMISGDDAAIAEVRRVVGDLEGAETKRALGFHAAVTVTPAAAQADIAAKVKAALARRAGFRPYKPQGQMVVDVAFKHYMPAEVLAYLPLFERTSAHSVRFRARDMVEASAIMEFVGEYRPDLTP